MLELCEEFEIVARDWISRWHIKESHGWEIASPLFTQLASRSSRWTVNPFSLFSKRETADRNDANIKENTITHVCYENTHCRPAKNVSKRHLIISDNNTWPETFLMCAKNRQTAVQSGRESSMLSELFSPKAHSKRSTKTFHSLKPPPREENFVT